MKADGGEGRWRGRAEDRRVEGLLGTEGGMKDGGNGQERRRLQSAR